MTEWERGQVSVRWTAEEFRTLVYLVSGLNPELVSGGVDGDAALVIAKAKGTLRLAEDHGSVNCSITGD